MRIRMEFGGGKPAQPSYDMLKAVLSAAQAATPTALASGPAASAEEAQEALVRLFGDADRRRRAALDGSFNPDLRRRLADDR